MPKESDCPDGVMVIVVPNAMAFRALVESPVLPLLQETGGNPIMVLSHREEDGSDPGTRLPAGVEWRDILKPCQGQPRQSWWRRGLRWAWTRFARFGFDYGNIAYRFNHLHGFRSHQFKQRMNPKRRVREALAGNFVDPVYGKPFPGSGRLYGWIYRLYYAWWQVPDRYIEAFFDQTNIFNMTLWYVQNPIYREYSLCIRRHGVRAVGIVGSWDRLTTKGPICPGCERYVVNSEIMRRELMEYHGVAGSDIDVVGWPQMDKYQIDDFVSPRAQFMSELGLKEQDRLIVFAGNSERLGQHEPSIVQFILEQLEKGAFGENIYLLIRTHPNDRNWRQRFGGAIDHAYATLMSAGMGNIQLLANTMAHCDMVISTQGSVSLDAVAFDRYVININFDGDLNPDPMESVKRLYEMEHYRPVVETGGVHLVADFDELKAAIHTGLVHPERSEEERRKLRELELEPFDGNAARRQVWSMTGTRMTGTTMSGER